MPPPDHFESHNPYQATVIDEKAVDAAEFFRAEPEYVKLVLGTVGRTAYAMFMRHKWRFIGLGVAQGTLVLLPFLATQWLVVTHPHVWLENAWAPVVAIVLIIMLAVFVITVSITASLRILRKEKQPLFSSKRDLTALLRDLLHVVLFMGTSGLVLVTAFSPLYLWALVFDSRIYEISDKALVFGAVFGFLLFLAWILAVAYMISRTCYAAHFIIDHKLDFLMAMAASWRHTRGNHSALIVKRAPPFIGLVSLMLVLATGGLWLFVAIGFQYCKGAVAYSMMTGQCRLLEQLPDEW